MYLYSDLDKSKFFNLDVLIKSLTEQKAVCSYCGMLGNIAENCKYCGAKTFKGVTYGKK